MAGSAARFAFVFTVSIAANAAARQPEIPPDTLIRLERTACYGPCPIYTVTIDGTGTVVYEGKENVRVSGRQTARIPQRRVAALLAAAERIRFYDLRDAYKFIEYPDGTITTVTDLPTKFVTVTANGRTKRVEDYVAAPDALDEFEHAIDDAANTKQWIFIDAKALAALGASGWSASGQEGTKLLREAVGRDEVAIARTLLEMGAVDQGFSPSHRVPLLHSAKSAAMVELLVKAGADPNERTVGAVAAHTPLMSAYYKDPGVTEALLKAGARLEDVDDGRTALWYAACQGNWRTVSVLLRAGANPRGSTEMPAISCTRQAREAKSRERSTVLNRGGRTVEDFDRVIALLEAAEKRNH